MGGKYLYSTPLSGRLLLTFSSRPSTSPCISPTLSRLWLSARWERPGIVSSLVSFPDQATNHLTNAVTIYEGTSSCDAKDDTRYRIYDGDASNVCQPFGKAESGDAGSNTCMEYTNGGTEYGDCTDETWTAKSMLVEKEADIYSCFSYENDSCEGDGRAVASQGEGDSGKSDYVCTENDNGFKSFKCVLANDTESVEEGVNVSSLQHLF